MSLGGGNNRGMYKDSHPFDKRSSESEYVRSKYKDRVPIICERAESCLNVDLIDKTKFLVPSTLTVGQFNFVIRKRLKLGAEQGFFMMTESGSMLPTAALMQQVYGEHKDEDGFLYLKYSGENAFGC